MHDSLRIFSYITTKLKTHPITIFFGYSKACQNNLNFCHCKNFKNMKCNTFSENWKNALMRLKKKEEEREAWWREGCPQISPLEISISWISKTQQITPSLHTSKSEWVICLQGLPKVESWESGSRLGGAKKLPHAAGTPCRRRERGEFAAYSEQLCLRGQQIPHSGAQGSGQKSKQELSAGVNSWVIAAAVVKQEAETWSLAATPTH